MEAVASGEESVFYHLPLLVLLAWVGYVDLKTRRIPNYANMALLGAALLCQASSSSPSLGVVVANIGLGLILSLPGYFTGVLGGGDVKLLVALSPAWDPLFLFGSFAAGVIVVGITLTIQKRGLLPSPQKAVSDGLPIGTCIAAGVGLLAITTLTQRHLL